MYVYIFSVLISNEGGVINLPTHLLKYQKMELTHYLQVTEAIFLLYLS